MKSPIEKKGWLELAKMVIMVMAIFLMIFYVATSCVDRCSRNESRWAAQVEQH